jgi:hypothetical protein
MAFGSSPKDAIKARTLNLTLGSGFAAFLAGGVTVFNDSFKAIFGDKLSAGQLASTKATILVAVIAAFAAIAVADLIARAWATAAKERRESLDEAFAIATAPSGLKATKTRGRDVAGFTVAAVRFKRADPDAVEYLLVKSGVAPEWVATKDVELAPA